MFKLISLVKTRPGTRPDIFRDYWRESYLRSLLALPELRSTMIKVTHNHTFPLVIRDDFPMSPWAGFSEIWFDRQSDMTAFLNHPAVLALPASHADVLAEVVHYPCTERLTWDLGVESPPIKMMAFFHPARTKTRAESQYYWTYRHVAIATGLNHPTRFAPRYVQNHVLLDHHTAKPEYDFAGAPELWFYSREAALELFGETDRLLELQADEAQFSDRAATVALMTDDQPVYTQAAGLIATP